jgi:hypothetical protein
MARSLPVAPAGEDGAKLPDLRHLRLPDAAEA